MSVPDWTRDATRPGADEVARVSVPLDPRLAAWARERTAPTDVELARIRPRTVPSTGAPWIVVWGLAAVGALLATGLWLARPETIEVVPAPVESGVYLVTPGIDVVPIAGVVASGQGRLVLVPGALQAEGDLRLAISSPVTVEHGGTRFFVRSASIDLGPDGLEVLEGSVEAPDGTVRAGERWPRPAVVAVTPPSKALPRRVEKRPTLPPPAPDDATEWRQVLDAIEGGTSDPVATLDRYVAAWPDSPFAVEAGALRLLLGGARAEALPVIERWLAAHPEAPRAPELQALAARIARDELHDCVRARPFDEAVAKAGGPAAVRATAFLGLCALSLGQADEGRALLDDLDPAALDPELRRAVIEARTE